MSETIGQQLQRAREARGVTLDEAALATRIRSRYLHALESDRPTDIPSAAQGRGFLRNYAEFLGIPAQPLLDTWAGKTSPAPSLLASDEITSETIEAQDNLLPNQSIPTPHRVSPTPQVGLASQQIFKEIGQELRRQRELLSLSLADVEKYTHVRLHYLKALEDGNMEALPSLVQSRGMLNNYANFLNLNADALLNRFADALQIRREERMGSSLAAAASNARPSASRPAQYGPFRRLLSLDLLLGSGIIIFLVAFIIWATSQVMAARNLEVTTQSAPAISDVLLSTATATGSPAPQETLSPTSDNLAPIAGEPQSPTVLPSIAAVEGDIQVYVVARYRSWLRVIVDNQVAFEGRTQPGSAYPFAGDQRIELVSGNAAALQVIFNQTDLGNLGEWSAVIDLIFTKEGLQTPTPTVTPTVTRTLPFTPTSPVENTRQPTPTPPVVDTYTPTP